MSEQDIKRLEHLKSIRYKSAINEQEIKLIEAKLVGKSKKFKHGDLVSVRLSFGIRYGKIIEIYNDGTADMLFFGFFADDPLSISPVGKTPVNVPMGNMRRWNGILPKNIC